MAICEQINQLIRNQSAEEPISEIHITKEDYKRLQEECLLHTNEREFSFAIDNTLDNPMGYSIRYQGVPVYIDEFEYVEIEVDEIEVDEININENELDSILNI